MFADSCNEECHQNKSCIRGAFVQTMQTDHKGAVVNQTFWNEVLDAARSGDAAKGAEVGTCM